ncbi:MAG: DUF5610 domain-containing protein [Gammaproteobacteria bacterium]
MHLGMLDNFSLNGNPLSRQSLAGRFQGFAYQGPMVVDNRVAPAISTTARTVEPALLAGGDAGGQLAGREIMTALEPLISPAPKPAAIDPFAAGESGPRSAADQVLGAVGQTLREAQQQGATPSELQGLAQQARAGVEQGLGEARNILAGMGVGAGSLTAQIDDTQAMLDEGLAALEAQFAPTTPRAVEQSFQVASSSARSLSLEITTRDGDTVVLSLSRSQASYQGTSQSITDGGVSTVLQSASYASANFSLSVNGQLDEGELEAIQGLMKKVDKLADKFFDGNVQAAFAKAMDMELDAEELVSFTLDMEMTRLRQVSSSYQSVGALDAGAATAPVAASSPTSLADTLNTLSGLFQDMQAAMDMPKLNNAFDKPSRIFRQLLGGAVELHPAQDDTAAAPVQAAGTPPGALLDKVSAVLAGEEAEGAEEQPDHQAPDSEDQEH